MSIDQKIAELLAEANRLKEQDLVEDAESVELEEDAEQIDEISDQLANKVAAQRKSNVASAIHKNKDMEGAHGTFSTQAKKSSDALHTAAKKLGRNQQLNYKRSVKEDVDALIEGEELTEEFKTKAATIFEAAVLSRVEHEVAQLEEQYEAKLEEEVESIAEGLIEKVDGYLNYVVEQWMCDNELALENGMKNEILESFVLGMKGLFEQHYIDVPEEKFDVLGDMQEQLNSVSSKLDEQLENNIELVRELNEMKRSIAINEATADMVDTDAEKFAALAEELSYDGADSYAQKLQIIKENYFGKKSSTTFVASAVTDAPVELAEESVKSLQEDVSPAMARYLRAFNGVK